MSRNFFPVCKLREPFLAASHLGGAMLGVIGTVILTMQCSGTDRCIVAIIYGLSLSLLFLVSGLLHGMHCSKKNEDFLERLDYIAIYMFIAGTYTPFCIFLVGGIHGTLILATQWIMAITGIFCTLRWGFACKWIQVGIFLSMGWMFLSIINTIALRLNPFALHLLIGGALFYSVGALIFAFAPENFFRNRINSHAVWHVFVLMGAISHYLMISSFMIS